MDIAVIGTGYVGLVTGACLANTGHHVTCIDKDIKKIWKLNNRQIPIYEPGLKKIVDKAFDKGTIAFSTDIANAINNCNVIFICVGTPSDHKSRADLSSLIAVVGSISFQDQHTKLDQKTIIIKSTVPVGTNEKMFLLLDKKHNVISNPEFLREGHALDDCTNPDRIVVGTRSKGETELMERIYKETISDFSPLVSMSPESAEVTKYAANGFLATKISYMNEIANFCTAVGADIDEVKKGVEGDSRIAGAFLNAGIGYGGSCFPKDIRALWRSAEEVDRPMVILGTVDIINERQKVVLMKPLLDHFDNNLEGKRIAIWGLAFKPDTDDIREAPSLDIVERLLDHRANVVVHDPQALENFKELFGERIEYCDNKMEAVKGADALVIVTEWDEYKRAHVDSVRYVMNDAVIFDGRNVFDPESMYDFMYYSIGRKTVYGETDESS